MKPFRLFEGPLTGRYYVSREYEVRENDDGDSYYEITGRKYDVTDDVEAAIDERLSALRETTTPAGEHLNALAERCHELAAARGKYPKGWTHKDGLHAIQDEMVEWSSEISVTPFRTDDGRSYDPEEFGDVLHAVLSVGHHMGYDVAEALTGAMERNRKRTEEGEP